ncbi:hypothetical protein BIY22_11890 [Vibrio panuliri]|uniref:Lipoprotein n=1 Tax=Vibrio panuliri TaxID=1381081 RepID=A0A1Q9HB20_9VIBR|nr:hypothetical protein [Vibrio panuliri]OLQ86342.1 hypothetical protein BIY22_11890 [Vibrio panuliri]
MSKQIGFLSLVISLVACTPMSYENQSVHVDVHPTKYQLSLVVDQQHSAKMTREWDEFYQLHKTELLNRDVQLSYSSTQGKKIAKEWREQLLNDGAIAQNIVLESTDKLGEFDLKIELVKYKVVTPICEPQSIRYYAKAPVGCSANSNLWQSMTYPDDALLLNK